MDPYKKAIIAGIIILSLTTTATIGAAFYRVYSVDIEYAQHTGDHLDKAESASTPEQYIQYLEQARTGAQELGIGEDEYAAYWSWEYIPTHKADFAYELIENNIDRAEDVMRWRETHRDDREDLSDVYEAKMHSLREANLHIISNVLHDTWMAKEHTTLFKWGLPLAIGNLVGGAALVSGMRGWSNRAQTWREQEERDLIISLALVGVALYIIIPLISAF